MPDATVDQLASLAPTNSFPMPPGVSADGFGSLAVSESLRTLAWSTEWEASCELVLVDLASGELRRRVPDLAVDSLVARGGGFCLVDDGYRSSGPRVDRRMLQFAEDGTCVGVRERMRGSVVSISPDGAMVALFGTAPNGGKRLDVVRWPGFERCASLSGLMPGVEWESGRMFCFDGERYVVCSVDGSAPSIVIERRDAIYPAGRGLAARDLDELTLYGLCQPWTTTLLPFDAMRDGVRQSVARGRSTVRACTQGALHRFEMDLDTGALLDSAIAGSLPDAPESEAPLFWHPTVDALLAPRDDRYRLWTSDAREILALPRGARPEFWFDDGRALLVTYPRRSRDRLRVEVWRVAASP